MCWINPDYRLVLFAYWPWVCQPWCILFGAPCTWICFHFIHNFLLGILILFGIQRLRKRNLHLYWLWQFINFILQLVRRLSSSHLTSSPQGKRNLCLRLQTKIVVFKPSWKTRREPNVYSQAYFSMFVKTVPIPKDLWRPQHHGLLTTSTKSPNPKSPIQEPNIKTSTHKTPW